MMATLAHHIRLESIAAGHPTVRGRLRVLPGSPGSAQVRQYATLLRMISILEAFTTASLVDRVEPLVPQSGTKVLQDIYERAEDRAIGSWPEIRNHYSAWLGINLQEKSFSRWGELQALLDARNAIVHGMGRLTRRLARKDLTALRRHFATLDLGLVGDEVQVPNNALGNAARLSCDFIRWLDSELRSYDTAGPLPARTVTP